MTAEEAQHFIIRNGNSNSLLFPVRNGDDLMGTCRNLWVIDTHGWSDVDLRRKVPEIYQHLYDTVYLERQSNRDSKLRKNWWLFRRSNEQVRTAIAELTRFIVTVETAKHRVFNFFDAGIKPEHAFIVFGFDDAFHLGVLSSRIHVVFALAAGGTLEDRPRYNKTRCFDPFPFPACDEPAKARIRALGEELDAHRKRVQVQHPGLSLTAMYNVLEALRDRVLTPKEQAIHDAGLVSVLSQLHDDLDAAVASAYGWDDLNECQEAARGGGFYDFKTGGIGQVDCSPEAFGAIYTAWQRELDAEILNRLVALNAERAAEEAAGKIRWLRPAYQAPAGASTQAGLSMTTKGTKAVKPKASKAKQPWPKSLAERVQAVERSLQSAVAPITAAAMAERFLRAKPEDIAEILDTLATLGRAHREGELFSA